MNISTTGPAWGEQKLAGFLALGAHNLTTCLSPMQSHLDAEKGDRQPYVLTRNRWYLVFLCQMVVGHNTVRGTS